MLLAALGGSGGLTGISSAATPQSRTLVFPRDFGSHPDTKIEWWYITGYVNAGKADTEQLYGFQVTFFRSKVEGTQDMKSALAAKQLLFAHAAVTDVQGKKLWHDQRIARSSGEVSLTAATASEQDTALQLRDWSLVRGKNGVYIANVNAADFQLKLQFTETQAVLLQGNNGLSRKGPQPEHASFYYSKPQLKVAGTVNVKGQTITVPATGGVAWLDHEWSDQVMPPGAVGWDWIGMNLFDGSALTAFRLRDKEGNSVWDGGSFRHPKMSPPEKPYVFTRGEAAFQAVRG
jgi:predicted secreted hydrolase